MDDTLSPRPDDDKPGRASSATPSADSPPPFSKIPTTVEETGLEEEFLLDLLVKALYTEGSMSGYEAAERLMLAPRVLNALLVTLRKMKFIEESKGTGPRRLDYIYSLLTEGRQRAREAMAESTYAGPCPVPLPIYAEAVSAQALGGRLSMVDRAHLEEGLSHLVLDEELFDRLGPAINTWRSIFIHGPPGNGKTAIAQAIGEMISEEYYLPYAIAVERHVIKLFDPVNHKALDPPWRADPEVQGDDRPDGDPRWLRCHRPIVVTGGEMTLGMLDLAFDPLSRYYEAPLQVKANGGMLLVDDFGRQMVSPRDLLNRWIVPMEEPRDYLTLHTGQKFAVPFDILTIFATNIEPRDLVDEAFLRRILYKVEVTDPTPEQFCRIFERVCAENDLDYKEELIEWLLEKHYDVQGLALRGCHPRDLVTLIVARAAFLGEPPKLTEETLMEACQAYFVG